MEKKKFYKIVVCKLTESEYSSDRYSTLSREYFRYGYSEKDAANKLRRKFKMNTHTEIVEYVRTKSPYLPANFKGKIFRHLEDIQGDTVIYYEWYVVEDIRRKPAKKD